MKINGLNNKLVTPWGGHKKKVNAFYLDSLDLHNFTNLFLSNLKVGISYSILFKVKYDESRFIMLGKQVGIKLYDINDIKSVNKLYSDFILLIKNFTDKYNPEVVELIQVLYIVLSDKPKLKLSNINKINLNKEFLNIKNTREKFNSRLLPLTLDNYYYGKLLKGNDCMFYIDIINTQNKLLNKDILNIDDIQSMYLYNDKYIIVNKKISNLLFHRNIYNFDSGTLLESVIDRVINNNFFIREIGNVSLTICNDKVINLKTKKELSVLKYEYKYTKDISNIFIGSLDLETFIDLDGFAKVYALGYKVLNKDVEVFYLNDDITSDQLVINCLNIMLNKYHGYLFYTHNFGKYDSIFILNILKRFNIEKGFDYYKLEPLYKDDVLLKLDIKIAIESKKEVDELSNYVIKKRRKKTIKSSKIGLKEKSLEESVNKKRTYTKYKKITIIDSYNLLSGKLFDLSRSFKLDVVKSYFPHEFVKRNTLNYVGNIPSIDFWKGISINEYEKLYKSDWNLKDECLAYLKKDLESLLKVIDTFNKYILRNYDIQMTDCTTISRLALNIFFKHYLNDSKIPIIRSSMFTDIKEAYYGGVTEVYKPHGFNLLYYDVNSLYPFASLKSMVGNKCFYMEDFSGLGLNLNDLFGFFYCEVEINNNYLGLLPVRTEIGLIMPTGKWSGWYFSEELKFAQSKGYKIKVIKGYNFNKEENIFSKYVNDLYEIKSKSTGHVKVIAKSLLNNLIGRFGMNIYKPKTEIVNSEKLDIIITTREYNSFKELTENDFLITYYPEISKDICESHDLNYLEVLKSEVNMERGLEAKDVSLTTAAAVTSYARIYLAEIKLDILDRGGKIYYTDTDSIVTDITLKDELVGSGLGQFKLEYKVKEAYFISAKTYCLVLYDNTTKIKAKGLSSSSLNLKDFKDLYKGVTISGMKVNSIKNLYKGSVVIKEDEIKLNPNVYKKREKIFKFGKWIDTKPLILNENENKLIKHDISPNNKKGYIKDKILKSDKFNKKNFSTINKLYFNYNTKHYFCTYTKKVCKNIYKFILYIIIYILLIIMLIISLGVFLIFLDHNFIYDNISTNPINSYLNNNNIDLFKKYSNNKYNLNIKPINQFIKNKKYDFNNKDGLISPSYQWSDDKSVILKEVYKLHLSSSNDEILYLRNKIDKLEYELYNSQIEIMNWNKSIDDTLEYMNNVNIKLEEIQKK
jgi:DNA polymerase type B, organellar and viral